MDTVVRPVGPARTGIQGLSPASHTINVIHEDWQCGAGPRIGADRPPIALPRPAGHTDPIDRTADEGMHTARAFSGLLSYLEVVTHGAPLVILLGCGGLEGGKPGGGGDGLGDRGLGGGGGGGAEGHGL